MKTSRRAIMFLAIISMYALIVIYIGAHLLLWVRQWVPAVPTAGFWLLYTLAAVGYFMAYIPWMKNVYPIKQGLKWLGAYYFALLEFAIALLLIADLIYVILAQFPVDMTYYIKVAGFVVTFVLMSIIVWGSRNAWATVTRQYPIAIDKQADDLPKLKIAVVSDIHLGDIVGKRHLQRMIDSINLRKPDLVLMVGDVLDDRIEPFIRQRMDQQLQGLEAKYGVFAVLGNHEYYGGTIATYVEMMDKVGIRVLQDEVIEVAGCYLVGRKDKAAETMDAEGRRTIDSLVTGLNSGKPIIVMDHQPFRLDQASDAGVDVLLCGHTHRGQFAPNHFVTQRMYELDWGYKRKEQMHTVVTSGYGVWGPPIRLGSRSEIVELEVTFSHDN